MMRDFVKLRAIVRRGVSGESWLGVECIDKEESAAYSHGEAPVLDLEFEFGLDVFHVVFIVGDSE